jgi:hypothetical protein
MISSPRDSFIANSLKTGSFSGCGVDISVAYRRIPSLIVGYSCSDFTRKNPKDLIIIPCYSIAGVLVSN